MRRENVLEKQNVGNALGMLHTCAHPISRAGKKPLSENENKELRRDEAFNEPSPPPRGSMPSFVVSNRSAKLGAMQLVYTVQPNGVVVNGSS